MQAVQCHPVRWVSLFFVFVFFFLFLFSCFFSSFLRNAFSQKSTRTSSLVMHALPCSGLDLCCCLVLFLLPVGSHAQEVPTARTAPRVSFPVQILLLNARPVLQACFCRIPERLDHALDARLALPAQRGPLSVQFVAMAHFPTCKMRLSARRVALESLAVEATPPTGQQSALPVTLVK